METIIQYSYYLLQCFCQFGSTVLQWNYHVMSYIATNPNSDNIIQINTVISFMGIITSQIISNIHLLHNNPVMIDNGFLSASLNQWMMRAFFCQPHCRKPYNIREQVKIIIIHIIQHKHNKIFAFFEFFKIEVIITLVVIIMYYMLISAYNRVK